MTGLHKTVMADDNICLPLFKEFGIQNKITLHVIDWHTKFDALLGSRDMRQLKARIDYDKKILKLGNTKIPFVYEFTDTDIRPHKEKYENKIKIPVNVENGDVLLPEIKISENCLIPQSIATAINGYVSLPIDSEVECNFAERLDATPLFTMEMKPPPNMNNKVDFSTSIKIDHLNPEERKTVLKICKEFPDIMYNENEELTFSNAVKHHIRTTTDEPIYTKSYRHPHALKDEIQRQVEKLLENKIIRPSISPYSAPVWVVPKKADSSGQRKWRMVIDYRQLNEKTIEDKYPLPRIEEILDNLGKSVYYTSLDLAQAFNQIEMHPDSIEKTAFTVNNGHYEYTRMPFGLKNAPSTFQRVMDHLLKDYLHKFCFVYLDDIIIFSKSLDEHYQHIRLIFKKLRDFNLKIELNKCEFFKKEVPFLGHVITQNGIRPNPSKIEAISKYPIPKTTKEIKSFLGIAGYYRRFIKDFSKIVAPITKCLKKNTKIDVNDPDYIAAFELCKELLTNAPILAYPDFQKTFYLTTDASNVALGGVLSQHDRPISFYSRTLNSAERNYSTTEKELLAIIECCKHFRPYLFGRRFTIETDHQPLVWLYKSKERNARLERWKIRLTEYDFNVVHRRGHTNKVADALSRIEINNGDSDDADSIRPNIDEIPVLTDDDIREILGPLTDPITPDNPPELPNLNDVPPVNPPEPPDLSDGDTIHTGPETTPNSVVFTDKSVNVFSNRIIIYTGEYFKRRITRPFNKNTHIITINRQDAEHAFTEIVKDTIGPGLAYGIFFFDDQLKYVFSDIVSKIILDGKCKIFICKTYLRDVITDDEQIDIVKRYHDVTHTGITETESHIKLQYYWPKIKETVTKVVNTCQLCLRAKYERNPYVLKFQGPLLAKRPFDIVHIDTFSFENSKFLTIIDLFSRYAQAYLVKGANAVNVLDKLRHYMSHHNIPQKIVCDEGSEFKNCTFEEFCNLNKIQLHYTTVNNPKSNSPIERFHSTLVEKLRILKLKNPREQPSSLVISAILIYNQTIHSSTGYSPFHLLYGPYDRLIELDRDLTLYENYNEKRKQELMPFYDQVYEKNRNKATNILEKRNENRQNPPNLEDREIYMTRNRPRKADPLFEPLRVIGQNDAQIVGMTDKNRITTTNIDKTKRLRRIPYFQPNIGNPEDNDDNPDTPPAPNSYSPRPGPSNRPD